MAGNVAPYVGPDRRVAMPHIEDIAKQAAKAGVIEFFEVLGVDVTTQEGRKRVRENLDWVDSFRRGTESAKNKAYGAGIVTLVTGLFYALWIGVRHPG